MQGIYSIIHKNSGKIYIGSSKNIQRRLRAHKCDLKNNTHPNPILQNYYNKYSLDSFEFNTMMIVENEDDLIIMENKVLAEFMEDPIIFDTTKVFNTQWAGRTGCVNPEQYKKGIEHHLYGKPSPKKGVLIPNHIRKNMSEGQKGKKVWNKGVPMSESTKQLQSKQKNGKPWSQARRDAQTKKS